VATDSLDPAPAVRSHGRRRRQVSNFVKLTHAYGYDLVLEKEDQRIVF
jgi:hypothetical protein